MIYLFLIIFIIGLMSIVYLTFKLDDNKKITNVSIIITLICVEVLILFFVFLLGIVYVSKYSVKEKTITLYTQELREGDFVSGLGTLKPDGCFDSIDYLTGKSYFDN